MRITRLLIIAIIVGSIYFYVKQHSVNSSGWQTISIATPNTIPLATIEFPQRPVSKTFQRNISSLGKIEFTTYQAVDDKHLFIVLAVSSIEKDIEQKNIQALEQAIHAINDTSLSTISHKQAFVQQSYQGIEYKASNDSGSEAWCRTIKNGNQLLSVIYTSSTSVLDIGPRDRFFRSLKL